MEDPIGSGDGLAAAVAVLLEERAIVRALHAYAHAMDRGDEAAWVAAFTPDALFDVVEVVGGRRVHREEGHADLARYISAYPKPPRYRQHVVVDPIVDVDPDGTTARVEAYWLLLERHDGTGVPVVAAFGHYHDRLVKQDGRWLIAERRADVQATTAVPHPPGSQGGPEDDR